MWKGHEPGQPKDPNDRQGQKAAADAGTGKDTKQLMWGFSFRRSSLAQELTGTLGSSQRSFPRGAFGSVFIVSFGCDFLGHTIVTFLERVFLLEFQGKVLESKMREPSLTSGVGLIMTGISESQSLGGAEYLPCILSHPVSSRLSCDSMRPICKKGAGEKKEDP